MQMNYLYHTIRQSDRGGFDVHGFFVQPGGVLAGQTLKRFIESFPTMEAAQAAYPQARTGHALLDPEVTLSHLPGENDPVPGGMYPDDIE